MIKRIAYVLRQRTGPEYNVRAYIDGPFEKARLFKRACDAANANHSKKYSITPVIVVVATQEAYDALGIEP